MAQYHKSSNFPGQFFKIQFFFFVLTILKLGVLLFLLYGAQRVPFLELHSTISRNTFLFNTFVLCQLFNEINSRKLGNGTYLALSLIYADNLFSELNVFSRFFTNPIFLIILGLSLVVQFLLIQFGGSFANTTPLSPAQWAFSVAIGFVTIPYGILVATVKKIV